MNCPAHPFGATTGLDCTRTDDHLTGHTFESAWLADSHTEEPNDD